MKTFLSVLGIFLLAGALNAQRPTKLVFWSGDPNCGIKNRSVTAEDKFTCASIPTERGPVSTVTYNNVTLSVLFLEKGDYNVVAAGIKNASDEPVFFDTDRWGAAHFKDKEAYQARTRPMRAETSMPSRDILKMMAASVRQESSLDTFIADGQKTQETKEIRRQDGTRYRVDVIVPDKDAQAAAARKTNSRAEMVMSEQRRIRETALTSKSVRPGTSVKGLVYFRREKDADFIVFSLSMADTTFVFQVPRERK